MWCIILEYKVFITSSVLTICSSNTDLYNADVCRINTFIIDTGEFASNTFLSVVNNYQNILFW